MTNKNIAICIRRPGRNYQPGGLQENYLTLRDAIVISIEKYQQYASASLRVRHVR